MLSREDIDNLPDDPELAFARVADLLEEYVEERDQEYNGMPINDARLCAEEVFAVIDSHDLDGSFSRLADRNPPTEPSAFWDWWREFLAAVRFYRVSILMKRRTTALVVVLDDDFRKQIHSMLNKVRALVPKLDVSVRKRDAIYALIARLQSEVDRQRTSTESLWALIMEGGSALGKAGKDAEPFIEALERIKKVFFEAKTKDIPPKLPGPEEQKRLPPPPKKGELDDDIPF